MLIHPWLQPVWQQFTQDRQRLPHALLVHGMAGVGKRDFALSLAQWLLCEVPDAGQACGQCRSCRWLEQGSHPDLRLLEPRQEEGGGDKGKRTRPLIGVEEVREVLEFLSLSAHQGGWRVVVMGPAETMNAAAANALLKTLEEPPAKVMLILLSHKPRRLLPTVRSRCRKLALPPPDEATARGWLAAQGLAGGDELLREAGGAPLLALELADAERIGRRDRFIFALSQPSTQDWPELALSIQTHLGEAWGWLHRWLWDLLACKSGVPPRYFPQYATALGRLAVQADMGRLLRLQHELLGAGRWLNHPLNGQLLLESWLLQYASVEGTDE